MTDIIGVASYILRGYGPMTTMKLQKLAYYSQAYSLTHGSLLFHEDFQAWMGGPVCPELYARHRGKFVVRDGDIPAEVAQLPNRSQRSLIDTVCAQLAPLSGNQLSERTHREDPWRDMREGLERTQPGNRTITKERIRDYYGNHPIGE